MAVYTHLSQSDITPLIKRFSLGAPLDLLGIAEGVENTNYLLTTSTGKYIITLLEKRTSPEDLPFFISFTKHLRASGILCTETLCDKNNLSTFEIKNRTGIISSFLEGSSKKVIAPDDCYKMGETCAQMHNAGLSFKDARKNAMGIDKWKKLITDVGVKADELEDGLYSRLIAEIEYLEKNWPKDVRQGAIHADLFPDNVFFENNKISGVIDFYFSCTDFYIYDLMLTFNAWCFNKGVFNKDHAGNFLKAYHTVRPLLEEEVLYLPLIARAAALRIVATRLYDWINRSEGAVVTPKNPLEHFEILKFHQAVQSATDYGFKK